MYHACIPDDREFQEDISGGDSLSTQLPCKQGGQFSFSKLSLKSHQDFIFNMDFRTACRSSEGRIYISLKFRKLH